MQFQVPQFIDTEDKIVGPLTLRQFFYVGGAAGLSVLLYFTVQLWLWLLLSLPIAAVGAALAFVKINGRPLAKLLVASTGFYWKPQTYVWQPEHPELPKNTSTLRTFFGDTFSSLENIVGGLALKNAEERVLVGSKANPLQSSILRPGKERYEILRRAGGERRAARRVDYR